MPLPLMSVTKNSRSHTWNSCLGNVSFSFSTIRFASDLAFDEWTIVDSSGTTLRFNRISSCVKITILINSCLKLLIAKNIQSITPFFWDHTLHFFSWNHSLASLYSSIIFSHTSILNLFFLSYLNSDFQTLQRISFSAFCYGQCMYHL